MNNDMVYLRMEQLALSNDERLGTFCFFNGERSGPLSFLPKRLKNETFRDLLSSFPPPPLLRSRIL